MRKWTRGSIAIALCIGCGLAGWGCTRTEKAAEPESVAEETVWEPEFASRFDARKACLYAMEYPLPFSTYTEESARRFREYVSDANQRLANAEITQEEIERLYHEILEKRELLQLR